MILELIKPLFLLVLCISIQINLYAKIHKPIFNLLFKTRASVCLQR